MFTHRKLTTIALNSLKVNNRARLQVCRYFIFIGLIFSFNTGYCIPYSGSKMVVTGPSPYAARTAEMVMNKGGNVVDVAVAMGLTLSVTSPYFAALGGGGFALLSIGGKTEALDFREVAPLKTSKSYFVDSKNRSSITGGTAVGVPGFPAGLYALHKKYGKLNWKTLFDHALKLSNQGFTVSGEWASKTSSTKSRFNPAGKKYLFKKDGSALKPGQKLKQPQLAKALNLLKKYGPRPFYHGVIAKDLTQSVQEAGGDLTLEDLKQYKVKWRAPLETSYLGYTVFLMPPPSSGGYVIKTALNLTESLKLLETPPRSTQEYHLLGEILSRAFRVRPLLGDPEYSKNKTEQYLTKKYFETLKSSISAKKHSTLPPLTESTPESSETTHYTVMDINGDAVSLTVTLNGRYGSGVVSSKYGIALNNEMDDFTTQPGKPNMFGLTQGSDNFVEPHKRPLSSMSPTIVKKGNETILALGAPGGPRIISSVFQVLYSVLGRKLDIDTAIQAPRVHHQSLPDTLYVDANKHSHEILQNLKSKGHKIEIGWQGRVNGILRDLKSSVLHASFDSRGEGANGGH